MTRKCALDIALDFVEKIPSMQRFLVRDWIKFNGINDGIAIRLAHEFGLYEEFPELHIRIDSSDPNFGKTILEIVEDHPIPIPSDYLSIDYTIRFAENELKYSDFYRVLDITPNVNHTVTDLSIESRSLWESSVILVSTPDEVITASDYLMKEPIIGFDVEWRPKSGVEDSDLCELVQLGTHNKAFLLDIIALSSTNN